MLMSNRKYECLYADVLLTFYFTNSTFLAMRWLDSILHYCMHPSFSFKDTQTCIIIKITRKKINATYPHLKSFLFSIFCYHWNNISLQFFNITLDHPSFISYFFLPCLLQHAILIDKDRHEKPISPHTQTSKSTQVIHRPN